MDWIPTSELRAFDLRARRHFWRWLGLFAFAAALGAAILVAIWPTLAWRTAFLFSGAICFYLLFAVISPWFDYRCWTRRSALAVAASLVAIALVVGSSAYLVARQAKGGVDLEKVGRFAAIAMLGMLALGAAGVAVSRLRMREAIERAARLEAEAQRERLERQGVQAELKVLQAQVEPHFLFNTLATVRHLVQGGSGDALPMLDHLVEYLRSALPEIRAETSTLAREAQLVRSYLAIMGMRMGGALQVAIEVPADLARAAFPPLMLITLVENAVKHGIGPRGGGRIAVRALQAGDMLRVTVEDDGPGVGGVLGSGIGLANTRERLRALYGECARLELSSAPVAGTVAAIEVPLG